jgi:hypothetical protein
MPVEQPFGSQWFRIILGGVNHHLDHAIDVPISRFDTRNVHTKSTRDR